MPLGKIDVLGYAGSLRAVVADSAAGTVVKQ
jgi:hypothetical protein